VTTSERHRVVHLLSRTDDAGAENQCRYLLRGLNGNPRLETELAYFDPGRGHEQFEQLGISMLRVPPRGRFRTDAYGRARRLRLAYRDREPAIFHTWMLEGNVIGMLAARAWPQAKVVITQRGSWNELDYPGMVRLQRLLLSRADHAISNSPGGVDMLASLGMARERISVIPNGIPTERSQVARSRADVRGELGWDGDDVVVWVGRVSDRETVGQKDLPTLFASFAALRRRRPGARLALIGPTPAELQAAGFGVPEGVTPLGWVGHPAEFIAAAEALVISSRVEGNSNAVGEALLLGVPVVSTDCGGHCPLVRQTGGKVVPVADPKSLSVALDEVLDADHDRAAIVAAAAENLSVDQMVARTVSVYEALTGPLT
jgi:glycosyltransferase involved in cell wall biosynthesis